jgi:hypothetical protein
MVFYEKEFYDDTNLAKYNLYVHDDGGKRLAGSEVVSNPKYDAWVAGGGGTAISSNNEYIIIVNNLPQLIPNYETIKAEREAAKAEYGRKMKCRSLIDQNVGDIYDLVADDSKYMAVLERLLLRFWLDYMGVYPMTEEEKETYTGYALTLILRYDKGVPIDRIDWEDEMELIQTLSIRKDMKKYYAGDYLNYPNVNRYPELNLFTVTSVEYTVT